MAQQQIPPTTGLRTPILASDADREQASRTLAAHYGAGRLTDVEFERRVAVVEAASTRQEIASALAGLPRLRGRMLRRWAHFERSLLPWHAATFATINGLLIATWVVAGEGLFWPAIALIPTSLLLGWHVAVDRVTQAAVRRRDREPG